MAVEREADRSPDHARRLPQGALGEHPRLIKPRMISRRIKSARLRREINRADRLRRERGRGKAGFAVSAPYSATDLDRTSGIVRWPSVRIPSVPPGSRREPPRVPDAHNPSTI